jgi:FSR family fosmidomycin resistance protein-like MFS transporter
MSAKPARNAILFSNIGHTYAHLFDPIFYIVALVLPGSLGMPYEDVLTLIVAGKLLLGIAAPLAGWLGDRWSAMGMMAVYFIGVAGAAIAVGLADGAMQIALALAALGFFTSIYHPVGMAWLVRNAEHQGRAVGINGVFGSAGPAFAGLIAGALIEWQGWRAAFLVPGLVVLLTGLAFLVMIKSGRVVETKVDRKPKPTAARGDALRAGLLLSVTMICSGLIYQATQPTLPKLFEDQLGQPAIFTAFGLEGIAAASISVTIVYAIAGLFQILAGHLTDLYSPKRVYIVAYLAQAPLFLLAASLSGLPLLLVAVMMVSLNQGGIPAENVLLTRYAPAKWRSTAFGFKFVLSFGVSGLAVPLVAWLRGTTGSFFWLLIALGGAALLAGLLACLLPRHDRDAAAKSESAPVPLGQPAE